MDTALLMLESSIGGARIVRGHVVAIGSGSIVVAVDERTEPIRCECLYSTRQTVADYSPGDQVLVWQSGAEDEIGVVLGRIGPALDSSQAPPEPQPATETPDSLLLEAKENLTLRVGAGSITLRKDGKILIRGKDLVSRADRMNRIKGGAVSIN